jgi:5-keto-L-gluconate epimerase
MIKLSYTVATPDVEDKNILCFRGDLENILQELSRAGYQGVEFMVRDVKLLNPGEIKSFCRTANLEVAAVSSGQLTFEDGLTISDLDRKVCGQAVVRTFEIIDFAKSLGSGIVNIGTLRGHLPSENNAREKANKHAVESMAEILNYAEQQGIVIAFEPQCRYVVNWHNTLSDTVEWMDQFKKDHFRILFDVYHTLIEEPSIIASLIKYKGRIAHIQFSDTNRLAPGKGQMNFPEIIRVLRALDYNGFVSVEIKQFPESTTAAHQAAQYLLPYLNETDW